MGRKTYDMKTKMYLIFFIIMIFSSSLNAQADVKIKKKDFKKEKSGFKEAWNYVGVGDIYFKEKGIWYGNAYDEYLKAIIYNSSNPELNYKAGVAALFSDNKEEAAGFLLKALGQKSNVTDDILLVTGRALQYYGNYPEAIVKLEEYLQAGIKKPKENVSHAQKWLQECKSALEITRDTLRIEIKNIGANINSGADDYSEVFTHDGKSIYFASRRELPKSSNYYKDSKFDENIFYSVLNSSGWAMAIPAGKNLITKLCEAPLYINSTNDRLYIYAGYENGGDIKVSETDKKGNWKIPEKIPFGINTSGSETSFTISPSGNEIFFVTNKGKDGYGGKDIYFIKKLNKKKWSKPINAGLLINTAYDEESVRFSKSGDTLWFSSKGHNSIGGFDIFYSIKNKAGEWDSVKNAGYPVNTTWDELFYYPSPVRDSSFYFVSNRSGGFGGFDIYEGRILPPVPVILPEPIPVPPPKPDTVIIRDTVIVIKEVAPAVIPVVQPEPPKELVLYLIGKVNDSETSDPIIAKIDVIDLSSNITIATTASSEVDGSYRVRLPAKKSYMVDIKGNGFLTDMRRISIPESYSEDVYNLNVSLIKVKVGKKVVLNNILFESGKAIITKGSSAELDRLFNILLDNAKMKIEISGHTDKTGSEPLNFKLSEERAKAVVDYMVQKGIDRSRLEYKGFGSLQPIDLNTTPEGRAKNRRVEFKILEF
jgi:outer membrane protein OmpA-like peptidoglycan-associated protein